MGNETGEYGVNLDRNWHIKVDSEFLAISDVSSTSFFLKYIYVNEISLYTRQLLPKTHIFFLQFLVLVS